MMADRSTNDITGFAAEWQRRYPGTPSVLNAALEALQPGFRDIPADVQTSLTRVVEIAWRDAAVTGDYSVVGETLTDLHQIIGEELDRIESRPQAAALPWSARH